LFIPEAMDQVGNLFWAVGHHSALGWSPFGVEDLSPEGQVAQAYKLLSPMLPQLAEWEAAGKVNCGFRSMWAVIPLACGHLKRCDVGSDSVGMWAAVFDLA